MMVLDAFWREECFVSLGPNHGPEVERPDRLARARMGRPETYLIRGIP